MVNRIHEGKCCFASALPLHCPDHWRGAAPATRTTRTRWSIFPLFFGIQYYGFTPSGKTAAPTWHNIGIGDVSLYEPRRGTVRKIANTDIIGTRRTR